MILTWFKTLFIGSNCLSDVRVTQARFPEWRQSDASAFPRVTSEWRHSIYRAGSTLQLHSRPYSDARNNCALSKVGSQFYYIILIVLYNAFSWKFSPCFDMDFSFIKLWCFFMKVLSVFRYGFFFHEIVMHYSLCYTDCYFVLYCAVGWGVSFCESISLCSIAFKSNFHSVLTVLKVTQAHESSLRVSIWIFLSCYIRHSFTIPRATVRIVLKWPC